MGTPSATSKSLFLLDETRLKLKVVKLSYSTIRYLFLGKRESGRYGYVQVAQSI